MEPLQSTLLAKVAQVPDLRSKRGQRFAWSYLLAILTAGLAAGLTPIVDITDCVSVIQTNISNGGFFGQFHAADFFWVFTGICFATAFLPGEWPR